VSVCPSKRKRGVGGDHGSARVSRSRRGPAGQRREEQEGRCCSKRGGCCMKRRARAYCLVIVGHLVE
jgi:hypothetical protein